MEKAQETSPAWLAYHPVADPELRLAWVQRLGSLSTPPYRAGKPLAQAVKEAKAGLRALLGAELPRGKARASTGLGMELVEGGEPEGFSLTASLGGISLAASDEAGLLYGLFRLLSLISRGVRPEGLALREAPHRALRMLDHWDNLDGSIERGYAGRSLFFRDGKILAPGPRLEAYARLLASVGINAVALNNVNVHGPETALITEAHLPKLARVAALLRAWGVKTFLSVNFAAPMTLGDLDSADPLDPRVIAWWEERARIVWEAIPDFGGFVVKADSEHRPGPFTYGRDHADGANLLARAVAPWGGLILWRCFVYNCLQDWRDRGTDRAKAAFDHFTPLEGRFLPNVRLQIKNGPMDFQAREPVSPLFGAMPSTRKILELQVTQEYLGQQRQLCYLPEQWKSYLDFAIGPQQDKGRLLNAVEGFVGVANTGDDPNWTGHDLAQANLYGFGRLAWDPRLEPRELAREWAALSYGSEPSLVEALSALLLGSWETYEAYTSPFGIGWMVNPSHHYGPNPEGYEYDRWGTYHFADRKGVGVDRTKASGTGYTAQYRSEIASLYEDLATCPDELLLFFHHLPYDYKLHSGATLIQAIYDAHFEGAAKAARMAEDWRALEKRVPEAVYRNVAERFAHQKEQAVLWRDTINTYFYRKSGVPDAKGRRIYP